MLGRSTLTNGSGAKASASGTASSSSARRAERRLHVPQPENARDQQPGELSAADASLQRADALVPAGFRLDLDDEHHADGAGARHPESNERRGRRVLRDPAWQRLREQGEPGEAEAAGERQPVLSAPIAPSADERRGDPGNGEGGVGQPGSRAGSGGERQDDRHHAALH